MEAPPPFQSVERLELRELRIQLPESGYDGDPPVPEMLAIPVPSGTGDRVLAIPILLGTWEATSWDVALPPPNPVGYALRGVLPAASFLPRAVLGESIGFVEAPPGTLLLARTAAEGQLPNFKNSPLPLRKEAARETEWYWTVVQSIREQWIWLCERAEEAGLQSNQGLLVEMPQPTQLTHSLRLPSVLDLPSPGKPVTLADGAIWILVEDTAIGRILILKTREAISPPHLALAGVPLPDLKGSPPWSISLPPASGDLLQVESHLGTWNLRLPPKGV